MQTRKDSGIILPSDS